MPQTDQIKKNMFIMYNNEPYFITDAEFYSPGKGSAFTRVKMKNLNTSRVIPFTFKSGERVEELLVNFQSMQYLYSDDTTVFFMDPDSYEQYGISKDIISQYIPYLKEGNEYVVTVHEGKPLTVKFPPQIVLTVTETSPAVKGNTSTNATKEATLETGFTAQVPLFIAVGDKIKIDPETNTYQGRSNE